MSMDILDVDMKNKRDDEDSFKEDWLMKDLMNERRISLDCEKLFAS
jgi:hypothetical protein